MSSDEELAALDSAKTGGVTKPPNYSVWHDRRDYYFDPIAAYNVVRFFESEIIHVKGPLAGKPLKLERWQRRFLRRLYGWKRRDDGSRRYRKAFIFVPRKNGKSFLGAGIALYGLVADKEMGAECVSAAVDREQARVIFDVAKQIVALNPRLQKLITSYSKALVVHKTASKYSVLSADVENKHGSNPSTIVFDELHTQPNGDLVEVLETGTAARLQPLTVFFTTAGVGKTSICYEEYKKAKGIAKEPWRNPNYLPLIFEAEAGEDWKDERVWKKANPNYGVSINPAVFRQHFLEACENKRLENGFKRLWLNMWTEQDERWLTIEQWDECYLAFTIEDCKDMLCVGGLDLSTRIDITAFCLVFKDHEGFYYVLPYFWLPKRDLKKKSDRDGVPYEVWAEQGYLFTTPGDIIDYAYLRKTINGLSEEVRIREIGFDPYRAEQLAIQLEHEDGFEMTEVRPGYNDLSEACKELEALLQSRKLRQNGNPLMKWMVENVGIETNHKGDIQPSKAESNTRIDGVAAMINAIARLIVRKGHKRSKYEDEGLQLI